MPKPDAVIITCEHGGNAVPPGLAAAFLPLRGMLATHRGWDPGALELARLMARQFKALLFASTISRLVVDLNRSEHHPRVFCRITRALPKPEREALLARHYRPFRAEVAAAIDKVVKHRRKVVHISVHSFTPVLSGIRRNADIGLLYDPRRSAERGIAVAWRTAMREQDPGLRVRMNYPYRGTSDGHTTSLRGRFQPGLYNGIELEINQAIVRGGGQRWADVQAVVVAALATALGQEPHSAAWKTGGRRVR